MNTQTVSDWENKMQDHRATLLNHLLLSAAVIGIAAMAAVYFSLPADTSTLKWWTTMVPFVVGWLVVLSTWAWRRLNHRYRALILLLLVYVLGCIMFARGGLPGSGRVWMLLLPALAFVLLGLRAGVAAGAISILTYAFFTLAIGHGWIVSRIDKDLTALTTLFNEGGSFLLVAIVLTLTLRSFYQSWVESLAGVSAANRRLQAQAQELEGTNQRLRRQISQLQATAEIAQAGFSILDLEKLMTEVVGQIQEVFSPLGIHYVGLFLLDETQRFVELKAATGEAAQLSLQVGHKVELDERSAVGWCIIHQQAHIVLNVGQDAVKLDALSIPHTRSEIALPLRSRGNIWGALSVQSSKEAAFSEADFAVLQMMADLVAVAIDNARLFSQTEAALEEAQTAQQRYLDQTWKDFLAMRPETHVDYTQPGTELGSDSFLREARREAVAQGQTVVTESQQIDDSDGTALVVPLKLREQVIGTVALHETDHRRPWTVEEVAMAETVAEQVALTIDNLRLFEQVQRRAARERLTREIVDKMRRATSVEDIVRTAVDELFNTLGTSRAFVRLGTALPAHDGES